MTLYAIRPDPETGALDEDAEVVDRLRHGWEYLEQAITVWRLVDERRADEIVAVKNHAVQAAGDGEIRFYAEDLQKLVPLLSGVIEAMIASGIVDRQWRVPAERLEELAMQVPAMDLKTERSLDDKTFALGEVMANAEAVPMFLSKALNAGCVVAFG
jgi:ATP phosphoribosyltransferase